jgi:hypothetical protein
VGTWRASALLLTVLIISQSLRKLGLPYSAEDFFETERADLPLLGSTELRDTASAP